MMQTYTAGTLKKARTVMFRSPKPEYEDNLLEPSDNTK
jgi:hypothetical protein